MISFSPYLCLLFSIVLEEVPLLIGLSESMDFLLKGMAGDGSECPFDVDDIQRCPFLRNINKPTNFSFSSTSMIIPVSCPCPSDQS